MKELYELCDNSSYNCSSYAEFTVFCDGVSPPLRFPPTLWARLSPVLSVVPIESSGFSSEWLPRSNSLTAENGAFVAIIVTVQYRGNGHFDYQQEVASGAPKFDGSGLYNPKV